MARHGFNSNATSVPLKLIYLMGHHPKTYKIISVCLISGNFVIAIAVLVSNLAVVFQFSNLTLIIDRFQAIILITEFLLKAAAICYHRSTLWKILGESSKFWSLIYFDSAVRNKSSTFLRTCVYINNFFLFICLIIAIIFDLEPLFTGRPPLTGYVPEGWKTWITYNDIYFSFVLYCYLMGFDTLFTSISCETIIQFKLLRQRFKSFKNDTGEFQKLVEHHKFLLELSKLINKLGAEVFMVQFVLTIVASCSQLFIVLQEGFSPENKIKCAIFFVGQFLEFGMYCVSGELMTTAAAEIGDAVYQSNWHLTRFGGVKNDLLIVIIKSQRGINFVAHGLVKFNLETLTVVFKTVLSLYTSLKAVGQRL